MARARAVFYTDGSPGCDPSLERAYGPIGEEAPVEVPEKVEEAKVVEVEPKAEVEIETEAEAEEAPKRSPRARK